MSAARVGLLKQGWNEIPEVLGCTFMALCGIAMGLTGISIYKSKNGDVRRHKFDYVVIRPDDPRAKTVKNY